MSKTLIDLGYGDVIGRLDTLCSECPGHHKVCLTIITTSSVEYKSNAHLPIREITIHGIDNLITLMDAINAEIEKVKRFQETILGKSKK